MSNELITYYEQYKEREGDNAYRMSNTGGSSRVFTLMQWIGTFVPAGGTILDVGCGDFYLGKTVKGYDWHGVDVAPNMADSDPRVVKQDLMTPPYPYAKESFDAAVCSEALEHLWDLRVVHKEIFRLLRPNGTYLMSTPNFDWIEHTLCSYGQLLFDPGKPWLFEHIRQYNHEIHEHFLKEAGFTIIDSTGADAHFGTFFLQARKTLKTVAKGWGHELADGQIDQILGACFPKHSHTIMFVCKKEAHLDK